MKNNRSRHHDLETLSAYLDHQLTDAEEQALVGRLADDKALQGQLESLRQSRYVLRQTPKVKRPRSFVLSAEMVQQQKFAFRMMNVSRWVSAAASILLIAAIGGQYLFRGGGFAATEAGQNLAFSADEAAEADMAEAPMMMEAPVEEMEMDDAASSGIAAEEAPVDEMEEPMAAEPAEDAAESTMMEEAATPTMAHTLEPGGGGGEPPGIGGGLPTEEGDGEILGVGGGPTLTPDPSESRMVPSEKTPGGAADQLVEPSESDSGEYMGESPETMIEPLSPQTEPEGGVTLFQIVQALFLVLAIAGGLTAAYFRKQVR